MNATPTPPTPAPPERLRARVHGPRLAGVGAAALFTGRYVREPATWTILDDVNLAVHEAGHLLFLPFGEFMMMLGGSLLQVLVPVAFVGAFVRARQPFAAAIVLCWVAVSLFNVSLYIGDARARQLPLLTGDPTSHDWAWLLIRLDLLQQDARIADLVRRVGVVCYLAAVGLGVRYSLRGPPAAGAARDGPGAAVPTAAAMRGSPHGRTIT